LKESADFSEKCWREKVGKWCWVFICIENNFLFHKDSLLLKIQKYASSSK
jgi:hypothetical protein